MGEEARQVGIVARAEMEIVKDTEADFFMDMQPPIHLRSTSSSVSLLAEYERTEPKGTVPPYHLPPNVRVTEVELLKAQTSCQCLLN